jgi:acetyl-CoA acetyltransferase
MKGRAILSGIGETEYSRNSGLSDKALQLQAIQRAIADAGLTPRQIDGFIPSSVMPSIYYEDLVENFGIPDLRFTAALHYGGASGVGGLQMATMAVASGVARHVVVVAGRNGVTGIGNISRALSVAPSKQVLDQASRQFEAPFGASVPMQFYGLIARRHMHLYGTRSEHFGHVAVTMRSHALLNPKAMMKKPITLEDHQNSKLLTDPFRLLDCCIESDGAAAYVVSAAETAADLKHPGVRILGVAEGHPDSPYSIATREDLMTTGTSKAAPRAFAMAGVKPADLGMAMLYDPFTFMVIFQLELLGICKPGEAADFVAGGGIGWQGRLPVNTHGGLHSQAHSMSGLNHICEAVKQLRGTAGPAQLGRTSPCVVTGFGDFGDSAVAILASA